MPPSALQFLRLCISSVLCYCPCVHKYRSLAAQLPVATCYLSFLQLQTFNIVGISGCTIAVVLLVLVENSKKLHVT